MFDMNKLFEEFIFEILKENKKDFEIKNIQREKQKKIFDNKENNFSMKPDIYIEFEKDEKIIIDTKYKKINCIKPKEIKKNLGFPKMIFIKSLHILNIIKLKKIFYFIRNMKKILMKN